MHELELNNLNAVEITKVAIDLKKVRKERRIIKNDIERVKTIKSFTDKYNNKFIVNEIKTLIKELYKLQKRQNKDVYKRQENMGKKRLAYEIKKFKEGTYMLFNFEAKPDSITELERV